jgi:hypothetical protein
MLPGSGEGRVRPALILAVEVMPVSTAHISVFDFDFYYELL